MGLVGRERVERFIGRRCVVGLVGRNGIVGVAEMMMGVEVGEGGNEVEEGTSEVKDIEIVDGPEERGGDVEAAENSGAASIDEPNIKERGSDREKADEAKVIIGEIEDVGDDGEEIEEGEAEGDGGGGEEEFSFEREVVIFEVEKVAEDGEGVADGARIAEEEEIADDREDDLEILDGDKGFVSADET